MPQSVRGRGAGPSARGPAAWAAAAFLLGAVPAGAQGPALLPVNAPDGFDLRVWVRGEEAADVQLTIGFGTLEPCVVSGRFDPARHANAYGFVAAATACGLTAKQRLMAADGGGLTDVRLEGTVRFDDGRLVPVSASQTYPLEDVFDGFITFTRGKIFLDPAVG